MKEKCPICNSENVKRDDEDGFSFLICKDCGYDEAESYESDMGDRKSKSSGGTPYKRGGSLRVQKR